MNSDANEKTLAEIKRRHRDCPAHVRARQTWKDMEVLLSLLASPSPAPAPPTDDMICNCGSELDGSHDHTTCGPPIPRDPPPARADAAKGAGEAGTYSDRLRTWIERDDCTSPEPYRSNMRQLIEEIDSLRGQLNTQLDHRAVADETLAAIAKAVGYTGPLIRDLPARVVAMEAAIRPVIREAEQREPFRHDTWNPDAHVELTLTIAEIRALDAALASPRGGEEK